MGDQEGLAESQAPSPVLSLDRLPGLLKGWIALQVAAFTVGPLLDPRRGRFWWSLIAWGLMVVALAYGMSRHSRLAWALALAAAVLGVVGGAGLFMGGADSRGYKIWYAWGLLISVAEVAVLLSPQVRAWIKQPTQRRWDP